MNETNRLTSRNSAIQAMLTSNNIQNFYRFVAQNPHIDLHDACQIIIERPNASVCFSFEEWNAMDRRVLKGKKGISFYDADGIKRFVFDANDTHGDSRYRRMIYPMKRLLIGLETLSGEELDEKLYGDYRKVQVGVANYLLRNDYLTDDEIKNRTLIEGVSYFLYSKTGFPKTNGITLHGLTGTLEENAQLFREVCETANFLHKEIEAAYVDKQNEVQVIDDVDEETVSDEPIVAQTKNLVEMHSAVRSNYKGYLAFVRYTDIHNLNAPVEVYLGKEENYTSGIYDNTDESLVFISNNQKMYAFLNGEGWVISQHEMVKRDVFSDNDYKEFFDLKNGALKEFEETREIKFGIDTNVEGSGVPFKYPDYEDKKPFVNPLYQRYLDAQEKYPNSVVVQRVGDFYEVMGEKAEMTAQELDLTLTGRNVGLPERVPMCGFPYHVADKYLNKILDNHSVVVLENGVEPKYILSHNELTEKDIFDKTLYGLVYNWKGLKEENSVYTEEYLKEVDEDFVPDVEQYEGAIAANKTYFCYRLNGKTREETEENVRAFLTGAKNDDSITSHDWYWESVTEDFFTGYENPTMKEVIERLNLSDSDLRMEEEPIKERPTLTPIDDPELDAFFDEQIKDDSAQEDFEDYELEDESQKDDFENEFSEDDDEEESEEVEENSKQPQKEKVGKPIKDRKRKKDAQYSLFDVLDGKPEKTPEEELAEYGFKRGSGFQHGKFRIYTEYESNPTNKEFAVFLQKEYGIGGTASFPFESEHNGKGISFRNRDKDDPSKDVVVKFNWEQAGIAIADLIDDGNYFTLEEAEEYKHYQAERTGSDESRIKEIANDVARLSKKYADENGEDRYFFSFCYANAWWIEEHKDAILEELKKHTELTNVTSDGDYFNLTFNTEYLAFDEQDRAKKKEEKAEEQAQNADLTEIGFNQAELGGAKARFQGNIEAIRLLNVLYDEDRNPTASEQKILAKYVGWGGLASAFDERDANWQKEYNELKTLLSVEDYERAKGSVLNAHYTSKEVIGGIYSALERFGVKGNNRILEPAMGTGNFFGFMPKEVSENAKLYGVELDGITGKIATKLYPKANVQIKGFEQTTFPNNHFDIVVGNVPFGAYSVYDSDYSKYNFYIHDYFLAKSIDKLKPNGLMAVITSHGTMDKLNPTVRKYLADRAELVGAIRLPNTAFKQTAGTEVVADILFFKKREEMINADTENTEWLATGKTQEGYDVNNYFLKHPEMVLGTMVVERGMYGAIDLTVKPDGRDLTEALKSAVGHLPENIYVNPEYTEDTQEETAEVDYNVKPLCYKAENGKLYMRIGERMEEQEIPQRPSDAYQRISEMITLRNELRHVLQIQTEGCTDEKLREEQRTLNNDYDRFVRRYGNVNSQTNTKLFKDDGDSALLFACENVSDDKKIATKADIFTKRTIRPYVAVTQTDDCFEGLQISKNERGKVDISYIEELTGKDYDTVISELGNSIFRNPTETNPEDKYSGFVTAEEYLSGNVVQKLELAKQYASDYPSLGYEKNIEALESVQPAPITASDIAVRIGASWVDKTYYEQFLRELLELPYYCRDGIEIYYNKHDSSWRLDKKPFVKYASTMKTQEVYGTKRADAYRLFEDCLNLKATTIYDMVDDGDGNQKRVLNQAETIAAREKQNQIKEAFKDWIWNDPTRREDLEMTYNAKFNQIRLPIYDGSYLRFPEMNPAIELKPHQKNAVHRIITSGNTLLHHVVGSGKTFTICASIMKLRQYGLAKKPMIAVPNHLVQQWANEFRSLYPNANLLIASKEDLEKENRKRFVSKVAMGDWDAVIIAQSSFAKIPISTERQVRKIQDEIARIEETVEATWMENEMPRGAVKNLEKIKKNRETQLKKLLDDDKKDNVLTFESLGVDYLFIDEAHYYKNKFLFTKMNNVAGISTAASQRASDLEMKCEYINELHGGDIGVVFATGTPISNSMTEMYTMQSYLQQETLKDIGITYFDGWAADFGETVTSLEMSPSGQGYKAKTRFAKFTNLPELLTLYRSFADVQTSDMVKLDVPETDRKVITLKPSDTVLELADDIAKRAEDISKGGIPPEIDNMLKVTSDGKKLALDPRCFERTATDEDGSKINECANRIFEIYTDTTETKGTQIVFCDLSTPKKAFEDYEYGKDFDVYNDLKYKLVKMGIPQEEIAYIHDANTDQQKQSLFDKVNSGKVRVLIGSTEKCGAGTNVQQRLIALHHLDTPYRPSDMQQREGRIIRQGNTNKEVKIFTYVTERTFDSYSYQILENKQRFISQIDRGDLTMREADDIDETTLSYAEIKAITAANPKIKRKMEVDTEITRLRVLEGQYKKNLFAIQDKIRKTFPEDIRRQTLYVERLQADIGKVKENFNPEVFSVNVLGKVYTDKKEGSMALLDAIMKSKPDTVVAEYGGMKISLNPLILLTEERSISLSGEGKYNMEIGQSASGLITRLDNFLTEFPSREQRALNKLEQLKNDLAVAEEQEKKPFEYKDKLAELLKEQAELNAELDLNKREEVVIDDEKETDIVSTDEENYMGLPEENKVNVPNQPRKRKPATKSMRQVYEREKAKEPNAYVILANNGFFELYGEQAEEVAKDYNLPIMTDTISGVEEKVVSMDNMVIDQVVRDLVDKGGKVKIVEQMPYEKKEETFIDNEDKIANMEVAVLPDYMVTQEDMKNYGYKWDGMLPVRRSVAKELYENGVLLFTLHDNDTNTVYEGDGFDSTKFYGVAKNDWQSYITSTEGNAYLSLKYIFADAVEKVLANDMPYVNGGDMLSEAVYPEREALKKYFNDHSLATVEEMKPQLKSVLDYTSSRFDMFSLEKYGWSKVNVKQALIRTFENDELKDYAETVIKQEHLHEFIDNGLKEITWLEDRNGHFNKDEIEDIVNDLKPYFEGSSFDESSLVVPYDDWYDFLAEEEIEPYLETKAFDIDKEIENTLDGMTSEQAQEFLGIDVKADPKAFVKESVAKEYAQFESEEMKKSPEDLIHKDNYRIRFYNELSTFFEEDYSDTLGDKRYEALAKDIPNVLSNLYDYYMDSEYVSINNYNDTVDLIKYYTARYHPEIFLPRTSREKVIDKINGEMSKVERSNVTDKQWTFYRCIQSAISSDDRVFFDKFFVALEEMNKPILPTIYDFYMKTNGDEGFTENTVGDTIIKYCISEMPEYVCPIDYGLDTSNTRYYYFANSLTKDDLDDLEGNADTFVVVAPNCYLTKQELEDNHIIFLKRERDILKGEIIDMDKAIGNMQRVRDKMLSQREQEARNVMKAHVACKESIEYQISQNFDGLHLNTDFAKDIVDEFGLQCVKEVLANTVRQKDSDGRFSVSNKAWAKNIELDDGLAFQLRYIVESHPAVLDGFIDHIRQIEKEEKKEETELPENQESKWININVSKDALIKKYDKHSFFKMPKGEYDGYTYNIFNDRYKDSTMLTDMQSDTRETSYMIHLANDESVHLSNRDGDEIELTAKEFKDIVYGVPSSEYAREVREDNNKWIAINVPREAMLGRYEKATKFTMPETSEKQGFSFYVPNTFIEEDKESDEERLNIQVPESFEFNVKNTETGETLKLTPDQMFDLFKNTNAEDFVSGVKKERTEKQESNDNDGWKYVSVAKEAKISEYADSTLFRMPKGEYEGYVYYIPNNLLRENEEKGTYRVSLPEKFVVTVLNKQAEDNQKIDFNAEAFIAEVKGKTASDYERYSKPSESKGSKFDAVEERLDKYVPEEMKAKPNWVIVRTSENEETGRLEKYLIDCHTGKFAKSDDPSTWTSYDEAKKYAKENGGVALAYALDGKDKICCIDVDHCLNEKGEYTSLVDSIMQKADGTYMERSLSGKGVHFFGKTDGMNIRAFSKDGGLEFYQKAHFIAMTGDTKTEAELKNFDISSLLNSKCERRTEWTGEGKGVEGLSKMSDRDVVEKAISSKHGETFKALYSGQDLQNNHSNSDMSLMNRLAFWCNGDKEQMLRIFATSGLYRSDKSADYYEGTAIKAIKDTANRFQPKETSVPVNNKPSSNNSGNSK